MTSLGYWLSLALIYSLLPTALGTDSIREAPPGDGDVLTGALDVSVDGLCGSGTTCSGSAWGQCCSIHGYCGNTDAYCGEGCNPAFGDCESRDPVTTIPPSCPTAPVCRVTATATIWVTATTNSLGGISTCPLVQTVTTQLRPSTTTVFSTRVVPTIVTSTTMMHMTVVSTQTVYITASAAGPSGVKTSSLPPTSTGGGRSTIIRPPPAPSPTLPGTRANCKTWHHVILGEYCRLIASYHNSDEAKMISLNPGLAASSEVTQECAVGDVARLQRGRCQISCDNLWLGYWLCVEV